MTSSKAGASLIESSCRQKGAYRRLAETDARNHALFAKSPRTSQESKQHDLAENTPRRGTEVTKCQQVFSLGRVYFSFFSEDNTPESHFKSHQNMRLKKDESISCSLQRP